MPSTFQIKCNIDKDDADWFRLTYGGTSYSWLFTMLLKKFREAHSMTPQDYGAIGAKELKKLLEDEDREDAP